MSKRRRRPGSIFNVAIATAAIAGAATAMVVGAVFLCLAVFYAMEPIAGAALAALLTAILSLMLVLTLALIAFLLPKPSLLGMIMPTEDEVYERLSGAVELGRTLGEEGAQAARQNMSGITLGALGLGVLFGISPSLRRAIAAILRGK